MCEKLKTRNYTNRKRSSFKTIQKHMFALKDVVQDYVKKCLVCQKLGFAVDAWTEDGTHFVAIVAMTFTDKYLLSFSTLSDESDMSSDAIIERFDYVLDTYGNDTASQVCFHDEPLIEDDKCLLEKV
ncbi:uncharacterized protein IUM83_18618 [Phytophthora cinnamomi]|uniref:uncharacterized protein n=1 Tax=Phytophthora cinnamomi TaxID=4785 RepID=UPI003559E04F|nr:hypothetical protein IUM83_18618 [Phytophthora cinnamomi]